MKAYGSRGFFGLAAVFACAWALAAGWAWWTSTPEYSLRGLRDALAERDGAEAARYVDVAAVVGNMLADREGSVAAGLEDASGMSPASREFMAALRRSAGEALRLMAGAVVEAEVRRFVASPDERNPVWREFAGLVPGWPRVERRGPSAVVRLSSSPLTFRMARVRGFGWRIVAVEAPPPGSPRPSSPLGR